MLQKPRIFVTCGWNMDPCAIVRVLQDDFGHGDRFPKEQDWARVLCVSCSSVFLCSMGCSILDRIHRFQGAQDIVDPRVDRGGISSAPPDGAPLVDDEEGADAQLVA